MNRAQHLFDYILQDVSAPVSCGECTPDKACGSVSCQNGLKPPEPYEIAQSVAIAVVPGLRQFKDAELYDDLMDLIDLVSDFMLEIAKAHIAAASKEEKDKLANAMVEGSQIGTAIGLGIDLTSSPTPNASKDSALTPEELAELGITEEDEP